MKRKKTTRSLEHQRALEAEHLRRERQPKKSKEWPKGKIFGVAFTFLLMIGIYSAWRFARARIAGAFNKVSMVNISLDDNRCNSCYGCLEACGMGITEMEDIGSSTDCILCGRCVEACLEKALRFTTKK